MKLVTHSRRGKKNEKGGGDEATGSGLYANKTHLICSAHALRVLML